MSILGNAFNDIPDFMEDIEEITNLLLYGKRQTIEGLEDEIWDIAREYKEAPVIGNIYNNLIFSYLENALLEKFVALDLKCDWDVNSICSSFCVNDEYITCENNCFESYEEFQQVLSLATANGVGTGEKFFNFLRENYSHKLIKN